MADSMRAPNANIIVSAAVGHRRKQYIHHIQKQPKNKVKKVETQNPPCGGLYAMFALWNRINKCNSHRVIIAY